MEKKYDLSPKNNENNELREPAVKYNYLAETEMKFSPPLTDEELKNSLTTDEVIDVWCKYLDEKFSK